MWRGTQTRTRRRTGRGSPGHTLVAAAEGGTTRRRRRGEEPWGDGGCGGCCEMSLLL